MAFLQRKRDETRLKIYDLTTVKRRIEEKIEELELLYPRHIKWKEIGKYIIQAQKKKNSLYAYIMKHYHILNSYFHLIFKTYPLYYSFYVPTEFPMNIRSIEFSFGQKEGYVNFLNFFYKSTISPKEYTVHNFDFCTYGASLESADGEVKLSFATCRYFHYIFGYSTNNFVNTLYDEFTKEDFFRKNEIMVFENRLLTNNIFYYKFLCFTLYIYGILYLIRQLPNNTSKHMIDCLHANEDYFNRLYTDIIAYDDTRKMISVYTEMHIQLNPRHREEEGEEKKKTQQERPFAFYPNIRIINKCIPIDRNNSCYREIAMNMEVNKLIFNKIANTLPITLNVYRILTPYKYANEYMQSKFLDTEKYKKVIQILQEQASSSSDEIMMIKNNNKSESKRSSPTYVNIQEIIYKLERSILTEESYCIAMEYVGRTFFDAPLIISTAVIRNMEILKSKQKHMDVIEKDFRGIIDKEPKNMFYPKGEKKPSSIANIYTIRNMYKLHFSIRQMKEQIFTVLYTLTALNQKIGVIHGDLHLNNLTFNEYRAHKEFGSGILREIAKEHTLSRFDVYYRMFHLRKYMYILSEEDPIDEHTFLVSTNCALLNIIDFSRGLQKSNKYECSERLVEMFVEIYPEYEADPSLHPFLDKFKDLCLIRHEYVFEILSGYDIFFLVQYFHGYFTTKEFMEMEAFPRLSNENLQFLISVYQYTRKWMLKKIKELMEMPLSSSGGKRDVASRIHREWNTNLHLMYHFFEAWRLCKFRKEQIMEKETDQKELIIDDLEYARYLYNHRKIDIMGIFRLYRPLEVSTLEEYVQQYIHVPPKRESR